MNRWNKACYKPARFHFGFSLLEVLVALIVLSVGLLSLAGMQVIGLRTNHSAYMRTQATIQSYDIIDRMRANIRGIRDGYYNNPSVSGSAGTQNTACESTSGCNSQQMAAHDLFRWNQAIADVLPNGVGVVCIDSTPEDGTPGATSGAPACDGVGAANPEVAMYAVKIWWNDDPSGNPLLFSTSFRP
ncbi:MAG: type IV pilus modification protein PilV [Candidatus Competibacter sp.]|nr:type IV pilus modification protein PilV [Candidatus Competibacter sp.]